MADDEEHDDGREAPAAAILWREIAAVFALVLAAVAGLSLTGDAVALVGANLYAIVAAVFVLVPYLLLERRGEPFARFGLTTAGWPQGLIWGLGATLVTLPLFALGYGLWGVYVRDQSFEPGWANYLQWPSELEGAPAGHGSRAGTWLWSAQGTLQVSMRAPESGPLRVTLRSETPFVARYRGSATMKAVDKLVREGDTLLSTAWSFDVRPGKGATRIEVDPRDGAPPAIDVVAQVRGQPGMADYVGLYKGPSAERVLSGRLTLERQLSWIWLWLLTHLIFVAFPEEFFYRGYLQTRIGDALRAGSGGELRERFGFTVPIVLTSALFAIGHIFVPIGGAIFASRGAVFFPSLLFGWLRRRTASIVAAVLYHAACNMMVLLLAVHFR